MKRSLLRLSRRYVAALRRHLASVFPRNLVPALGLGRQAARLGMETLELARMHERAVAALGLTSGNNRRLKQAEIFFGEALLPIVGAPGAARLVKVEMNRLNLELDRRTLELAATNRRLLRGVSKRKGVEAALKTSHRQCRKLLKNSLALQSGMRQLTHSILATQEQERKNLSHQLQDGVAQMLLGINVRLLNLKSAGKGSRASLVKAIASTQRVVESSLKSIHRLTRGLAPRKTADLARAARHCAADPGSC